MLNLIDIILYFLKMQDCHSASLLNHKRHYTRISETFSVTLRGYCTPNLKLGCCVCCIEIINLFWKNNV